MKRDRSRRRRRDPSTSLSAPPPKRTSSEKHSRRPQLRAKHERRSKSAPRKRARQEQDTHSSARASTDKGHEKLFEVKPLPRFPPEVYRGPPQTITQQGKETHPSTFFLLKSHLTHLYIFITLFYHLFIFSCTRGQCYSSFLSFIYFVYATGDKVVGRYAQHHHVLPDREVCQAADCCMGLHELEHSHVLQSYGAPLDSLRLPLRPTFLWCAGRGKRKGSTRLPLGKRTAFP